MIRPRAGRGACYDTRDDSRTDADRRARRRPVASTPSAIETAIKTAAAGPRKASGDAGSVEGHPLRELVEADRYTAAKEAARAGRTGIRVGRVAPGGAAPS